ncbi:sigma 54-interacting transcriptional regulator [Sedimentibacter sp.]|uniref:sigma-54 interaction domain-containing protein n=1 Tax=Sedimentibacter sp. TaxID=1960295 RepID=UPI0028B19B13|nr:sigma 54-interacting transcriptional regulator [Sedimentibacter sp.]
MNSNGLKELFYDSDLILIIDKNGKVMYYDDYDDNLNMLKKENVVGRSIFELYPFFKREDFTVFRAMDGKEPILNEYQTFTVDGNKKNCLNNAFPLINETGVIGGIVISVELSSKAVKRKIRKSTSRYDFEDIITENQEFRKSLEILKKVSKSESNVLIIGETGTGKELIAHSIHSNSSRRNKPFIIQNCAAIPSSIMESILFGTAKGSFTGSMDKEGLFESANGGTIFLDEINSVPYDLQSKLLRTLENKNIMRIGENIEREIDIRIIASTNEDLARKVDKGEFRADLYYRLNVISFNIPPLKERKEDIKVLVDYYINQYNSILNKNITGISKDVLQILNDYDWKGNVRELKNVIEYALNFSEDGILNMDSLPQYLMKTINSEKKERLTGGSLTTMVDNYECKLIKDALESCKYNILKTAEFLNIPRQTLYYKLKKYNIE